MTGALMPTTLSEGVTASRWRWRTRSVGNDGILYRPAADGRRARRADAPACGLHRAIPDTRRCWRAGIAVWAQRQRKSTTTRRSLHERSLLDVEVEHTEMQARGFDRVVLLGNRAARAFTFTFQQACCPANGLDGGRPWAKVELEVGSRSRAGVICWRRPRRATGECGLALHRSGGGDEPIQRDRSPELDLFAPETGSGAAGSLHYDPEFPAALRAAQAQGQRSTTRWGRAWPGNAERGVTRTRTRLPDASAPRRGRVRGRHRTAARPRPATRLDRRSATGSIFGSRRHHNFGRSASGGSRTPTNGCDWSGPQIHAC